MLTATIVRSGDVTAMLSTKDFSNDVLLLILNTNLGFLLESGVQ
jgi:hypothetical protein